jgi:uncharacterized lipoprotein YmbA
MVLRPWTSRTVRPARCVSRASLVALAALWIAACANGEPTVTGSIPSPPAAAGTIAFEAVDGPTRSVFDRYVAALSAEAEERDLPVVTHTGPSAYRVRVYLATYIENRKKRATLSWTWDVFDTRENRTFRLTGEEVLGTPQDDVWAQVGDETLRRIAGKGLAALASRAGPVPSRPAKPDAAGAAVAFTGAQ